MPYPGPGARGGRNDLAWGMTFAGSLLDAGCLSVVFSRWTLLRVRWHGVQGRRLCHPPTEKIRMGTQCRDAPKFSLDA